MAETRLEAKLEMDIEQAIKALRQFRKTLGDDIPEAAGRGEDGVNKFTGTIGVLVGRLPKLQTALLKATDPKQIERLNVIIAETQKRINTLSNQGLNKLTSAYGGASGAALNFGRIAQDASFGFLGIANNIEPFIFSLKELRSDSKTTGEAVKRFFGSLAGPAGVGVLVGLVSLFDAYSKGYGIFSSKTKEAAKAVQDLGKSFTDAFAQEGGKSLATLESLRKTIENGNLAIDTRKQAIKELRELYPTYFKDISNETLLAGGAADAYRLLASELVKTARARAAQGNLEKLAGDRLRLEEARAKLLVKTTQELAEARTKVFEGFSTSGGGTGGGRFVTGEEQRQLAINAILERRRTALGGLDGQLQRISTQEQFYSKVLESGKDAQQNTTDAQEDYKKKLKETEAQQKKNNKELEKAAELAKKAREELDAFDRAFGNILDINRSTRQGLSTLELFNLELKQLQEMQLGAMTSEEFEQIAVQIALAEQRIEAFKNSTQQLIDTANKIEDAFGFDEMLNFNQDESKTLEALTEMEKTIANIQTAFGLLGPAIDQSFNALANGQNVFDALGQAIKRLIIDLAKAAALAAILSIATGGATGAGVLIGGTKLKGFADIFKGLLGFRAAGGPVSGGSPYIVGEKGPELFVPENGGRIIPNSALMNGGGAMGGVLTARVEGSDLLFVLERAQRSAGRRR